MKKITVQITLAQANALTTALILALRVVPRGTKQARSLAIISRRLADAIEAAFPEESR